jgi:hypothetical protein
LRLRLTRRGLTLPAALAASVLVEPAAAALPAGLAETTVKAAIRFAAGKGLVAVSAPAALAEGVLRAMFLSKVKVTVATVLALGLLGTGAGLLSRQAPAAQPPAPEKPAAEKAPAPGPNRLRGLLEARVQAAEQELQARYQEFLAGRGTLDICIGAARRVVEANRDLGLKKEDWIAVLEAHEKMMKAIHGTNDDRFTNGRIPIQDFKESEYYYLEAQIWLERAKGQ